MPLQTDLMASPYYDDYDPSKDYYKILFRPGVAVQTRELNQLQTLLQKQIERFGDNILKRGSIVDGCSFVIESSLPYIKINDTTDTFTVANVASYANLTIKNSSNLHAHVVSYANGFQSQAPDLKTLYIKYKNSGTNKTTNAFSSGDLLTVFNDDYRLYSVTVGAGSTGFSNSDSVVIQAALEVQNTTGGTTLSGSFTVGELVTQTDTNAKGVVTAVSSSANSDAVVISIKPTDTDLSLQNTAGWAFTSGKEVTGNTSSVSANVVGFAGSGATGTVRTAAAGRVDSITVTDGGTGYYIAPEIAISSSSATTGEIAAYSFTALNYLNKITVSSLANSTGHGLGVHVTPGVIYQKGYFERVAKQFLVVEKYANTPSDVVVGFTTTESVVNASADTSLQDNASGELNRTAPGADRLKLVPTLSKKTKAAAETDTEFFALIEFSNGKPFIQHRLSQYNKLADELARRTSEESGNYVLDPFQVTTQAVSSFANTENYFSVVVDPGHAYINGYRVQTLRNYTAQVDKAKTTVTANSQTLDVTYGNYLRVNEVGGALNFTVGDQLSLRDTAADYLTDSAGSLTTAPGSEIGKARARSILYESGEPGTPDAIYRVYLYDIKMNQGKNFNDVRCVYDDNGTNDFVGDAVLETDPAGSGQIARIRENNKNKLIFGDEKIKAVQSISNISYIYKTLNQTLQANTLGLITITVSNTSGEDFPYSGTLSTAEQQDIIVMPIDDEIVAATNSSGSIVAAGNTVTGTATAFVTEFQAGDYFKANDGSNTAVARIVGIANNTSLTISNNVLDTVGSGANIALAFPRNVPIAISTRSGRSANVSGDSDTLTINLGTAIDATSNVAVVYNVKSVGNQPVSKSPTRKVYVKIDTSTHSATTVGPWCLGAADIFRLRAVYAGATTSDTNATKHFYIDHNQTANFYDQGWLYLRPTSTYTPSGTLLVEFDVFTHDVEGLKVLSSYPIQDSLTLTQLDSTSNVHTLEIPEVFAADGTYFDLRDAFDFRPRSVDSANLATSAGSADTNPSATDPASFSSDNKKFPAPESDITFNYTYYTPRTDTVLVKSTGNIEILKNEVRLEGNRDEIILNYITVPPYPSLPIAYSSDLITLLDKGIANEKYSYKRESDYKTSIASVSNQPRGYTMEEIGKLDRRIEALEYYARLSRIEQEVKDKVIPSENDPTVDRYKFGFFVDNFTTEELSDLDNPEYNANIYEYRLYPKTETQNFNYVLSSNTDNDPLSTGDDLSLPYADTTIISQGLVTDGAVDTSGSSSNTSGNSYSSTCVNNPSVNSRWSNDKDVYEEKVYTLTSNTQADGATVTVYFNVFGGKDRIEVYQSTSASSFTGDAIETSASTTAVSNLTQAEKNYLNNKNIDTGRSSQNNWNTAKDFSRVSDGSTDYWIKDTGKLTFTYDVSAGQYIKVKVIKGSPHHFYRICYPGDDLGTPATDDYVVPVTKSKSKPVVKTETTGKATGKPRPFDPNLKQQ